MHDASVAALTAVRKAFQHGEDQFIRAREQFRHRTQTALEVFQKTVRNTPGITANHGLLEPLVSLNLECGEAARELDETVAQLTRAGFEES